MSWRERFSQFEKKSLESGVAVVAGATIVGSLMGVLKNALLASRFGASGSLDVYFAAFRIPDFLYNIVIFSALSGAFFPIFSRALTQGKMSAWRLLAALIWFFSILLGIGAVIAFFCSHALASFLAPGFSGDQLNQLSAILKILMLQPIGMALANLFANALQTFKRFFVSTLAPVFYNGGIIAGILWLAPHSGITGVAWGAVVGALAYAVVQLPTLHGLGFRMNWRAGECRGCWRDVWSMMVLMGPRALTLAMNQLVLVWITIVSSVLVSGSLAAYSFADAIQSLPQTIVALAFVTVAFPALSGLWARFRHSEASEERARFVSVFDRAAGQIALWLIPAGALIGVFAEPIVRILLGYGSFIARDQHMTAVTLVAFAVGIPFQGLLMLVVRTFFAMEDTKHPFMAVLGSLVCVIPGVWLLGQRFGAPGLALGMVGGNSIVVIVLLIVLSRRLGGARFPILSYGAWHGLILAGLAAVPGALCWWGLSLVLRSQVFSAIVFRAALSGIVSCVSLAVGLWVWKLVDFSFIAPPQDSESAPASELESPAPDLHG
jgi:putative peptidoglycan lipid II flippase